MRLASRLAFLTRQPWVVLAPLIGAQWVAVAIFALVTRHDGWLYYQGGDETFYYTTAWAMSEGHLPRSFIGYGWSYLIAPVAWIADANILVALPAIVLVQVVFLLPLALVCVYGIAASIGGRLLGYAGAALWVAIPYLAIPLFVDRYHEKFTELFLPQALGLSALGDFPSMVALLVATYLLFRSFDAPNPRAAAAAGIAAGFAIGIKPANALFLPAVAVGLALARRPREALGFAAGIAPALLTLLLWKQRGLGNVPLLAVEEIRVAAGAAVAAVPSSLPLGTSLSEYLQIDWGRLGQQRDGFQEYFWSVRLLEWTPIAGTLAVARRSPAKAAFLAVWLVAFFVFKGSAPVSSVSSGSFWRLFMPAFPAFFFLAVAIPLLVPTYGLRLAERFHAELPRGGRRIGIVAAVAFAAGPLALAAALPPLKEPRVAKEFGASLFVPIDPSFGLTASTTGGAVSLEWERQRRGKSTVYYRLYRAPVRASGAGLLCNPLPGAADCSLQMAVVTTMQRTEWVDRPPPGRWTYRVGVLAGWRAEARTADLLFLSRPAAVVVAH